jgi:hypothetical protein
MRRHFLTLAALVTVICCGLSDQANALPLGSPAGLRAAINPIDEISCRPPPWYSGWRQYAPWVCSHYWWWPRFYYRGMGVHHHRRVHRVDP